MGKRAIHVIHGVEISGAHEDREFHLLVYFPGQMPLSFQKFCRERAQKRAIRYENAHKNSPFPPFQRPVTPLAQDSAHSLDFTSLKPSWNPKPFPRNPERLNTTWDDSTVCFLRSTSRLLTPFKLHERRVVSVHGPIPAGTMLWLMPRLSWKLDSKD